MRLRNHMLPIHVLLNIVSLWKQALILGLSGWVGERVGRCYDRIISRQKLETHNISTHKSGSGSSLSKTTFITCKLNTGHALKGRSKPRPLF